MAIDVAQGMLRAAGHLDSAAQAVQRGADVDVPRFFGRRAAVRRADAQYSSAAALGERALRELGGLGAPVQDARAGIRAALDLLEARAGKPAYGPEYEQRFVREARGALQIEARRLRYRVDMAALPQEGLTQRLRADIDGILTRPNDAIGTDDLWKIGLAASLPEGQRVRLPQPVSPRMTFERLALDGGTGTGILPERELDNLRLDVARRAIEADPNASRAALTEELRAILAKEQSGVTHGDVRRVSVMAGLPDRLRPAALDAPTFFPGAQLDQLSALQFDPAHDVRVRAKLEAVRRGQELEDLLADPTLTRDMVLRRQALRALSSTTGSTRMRDDLAGQIRFIRDTMAGTRATDPAVDALRVEALDLAERNLARMGGRLQDGYDSHPDYAEVGRLASIATLLDSIASRPAPTAADAAEVLPW